MGGHGSCPVAPDPADHLHCPKHDVRRGAILGWTGSISLGLALLIAAVAGGALVAIAGVIRVTQLRLNARRARRELAGT
jgi:hypothetical protein